MIFRQLFEHETWTYTYLLADPDSRKAVLIDCVFERHIRDLAMIRELDLSLETVLDTHAHADHVTGAGLMRLATGCQIAISRASGATGADRYLDDGDTVSAGSLKLEARSTPGHTGGCMTFVAEAQAMAFTGDTLLIRGAGRTDFQQGDPASLFRSVRERIFTLPDEFALYPGHDYNGRTSTTVAEERTHNPRLGEGIREEDFVGYMDNLDLPHPKRLAAAVPANMRCGAPGDGALVPAAPDWGPVVRTFAGVLEIDPEWVHQHRDALTFVEVREAAELDAGPLPSIEGAVNIPLSVLLDRHSELPTTRPVITLCPAGARSGQAALILEKAGFERVANLPGGQFQ